MPVYNSAARLKSVVQRVDRASQDYVRRELVLVNDGSSDASWSVISSLVNEFSWLVGIDLMRNYGQHAALLAGVRAARNSIIVTLDDDLQYGPEHISLMVQKLGEGQDVIYGIAQRPQHLWWRNVTSWVAKLIFFNLLHINLAPDISPFRAFWTSLREGFGDSKGTHLTLDTLLFWSASSFGVISVPHERRADGESSYTLRKLTTYALAVATGFTTLPLYLALIVGVLIMVVGLAVAGYAVVGSILGQSGSASLVLAGTILITSGIQLLVLGIIGMYLAQVHLNTMGKPAYLVRTIIAGAEH
jgi:undecaprenyl-phosphate 4-deoxy-4-formamido-L-arabinose transferase